MDDVEPAGLSKLCDRSDPDNLPGKGNNGHARLGMVTWIDAHHLWQALSCVARGLRLSSQIDRRVRKSRALVAAMEPSHAQASRKLRVIFFRAQAERSDR